MRQYCRSSLAHNVLTVDGENQCDIYSKFRMGRRGRITSRTSGHLEGFQWARASHDGYRHLAVKRIERMVAVGPSDLWICADIAYSIKNKRLLGYLHLSPQVSLTKLQPTSQGDLLFKAEDQHTMRIVRFFGCRNVSIEPGWYCPAFGVREQNSVLVYELNSTNTPGGWMLSRTEPMVEVVSNKNELTISIPHYNNINWKFH